MTRRGLALLVTLAALAVGCARGETAQEWVGRSLAAHAEADRLVSAGDVTGARKVLEQAAEAAVPGDASPADARIVRQDLYYRLAELDLGTGRTEDAARWASRGLALGRGNDVFTANLLIARGHALEKANDALGASRDYHDALVLTDALLDRTLDGARSP